jgi:hypothetical protein
MQMPRAQIVYYVSVTAGLSSFSLNRAQAIFYYCAHLPTASKTSPSAERPSALCFQNIAVSSPPIRPLCLHSRRRSSVYHPLRSRSWAPRQIQACRQFCPEGPLHFTRHSEHNLGILSPLRFTQALTLYSNVRALARALVESSHLSAICFIGECPTVPFTHVYLDSFQFVSNCNNDNLWL